MSKKKIFQKLIANKSTIKQFGVQSIGLFGSYARGNARKESDVDLLVKFSEKTFDNYMDLKFFLQKQLKAKVDLVIYEALKPQLKSIILKEVEYAQGI
jgi:hypothetical protein